MVPSSNSDEKNIKSKKKSFFLFVLFGGKLLQTFRRGGESFFECTSFGLLKYNSHFLGAIFGV